VQLSASGALLVRGARGTAAGVVRGEAPSVTDLYLCSLVGIAVTALLFLLTDYYTSTRFAPVKKTAARVADRARDEHHLRPRPGTAGDRPAALVLVLGILGSWSSRAAERSASTASGSRSWASSRSRG
jgi:K(+)-stimulated pyrophosphate-energized sodium pump